LEQGQLQRALTITSAGYAEPDQMNRSLTITSAGYAVPDAASKPAIVVESPPDIMIQPLPQPSAAAVFQMQAPENPVLVGAAFGQIYDA
jgi:hypothetical protein